MQRTARIMQGLLGVITALGGYLTYLHYTGGVAACPTTPLINCTRVLTSGGSVVLGLPLPAWGALWALVGWVQLPRSGRWVWLGVGMAGLVWAWGHELALQTLCLWCSGMQVGIIGAMIAGWPKRASHFGTSQTAN